MSTLLEPSDRKVEAPKKSSSKKSVRINPKVSIQQIPKKRTIKNTTHPHRHGANGYLEFENNNQEVETFFGAPYIEHRNLHPFMGTNINGSRKSRNVPENLTRHVYLPRSYIPITQPRRRALNAETPRYVSPLYNNRNNNGTIIQRVPFSGGIKKKKSIKKKSIKKSVKSKK